MLEQARGRVPSESVRWVERTAAEIDALPAGSFDAVVASLCLSEMSGDERSFVLRAALHPLRAAGLLVVADAVRAGPGWQRGLQLVTRAPQAALAWVLTGSVARLIPDLVGEVVAAGFEVREVRRWLTGTLTMIVAVGP